MQMVHAEPSAFSKKNKTTCFIYFHDRDHFSNGIETDIRIPTGNNQKNRLDTDAVADARPDIFV